MSIENDIREALNEFADLAPAECGRFYEAQVGRGNDDFDDSISRLFDAGAEVDEVRERSVRHRRRATFGIAAFALLAAGLTTAAAAGAPTLPSALVNSFGWQHERGAYNPEPATASMLVSARGPDIEFSTASGGEAHKVRKTAAVTELWYADASDNGYCTALVNVPRSSAGQTPTLPRGSFNRETNNVTLGGQCGAKRPGVFGGEGGYSFGGHGPLTFSYSVPGAARVEVQTEDGGKLSSPPTGNGWTEGQIAAGQVRNGVKLVGYDAHGRVVGSVDLRPS